MDILKPKHGCVLAVVCDHSERCSQLESTVSFASLAANVDVCTHFLADLAAALGKTRADE